MEHYDSQEQRNESAGLIESNFLKVERASSNLSKVTFSEKRNTTHFRNESE